MTLKRSIAFIVLVASLLAGAPAIAVDPFATADAPDIAVVGGSCGGKVTVAGTGFTPNREVAVVAAQNMNGFVKGGLRCNGVMVEVGRPFKLPANRTTADGSGNISLSVNTAGRPFCFIEALDWARCTTSNATLAN